eukprot:4265635-Pleurochrysis_carterae.AAC.2
MKVADVEALRLDMEEMAASEAASAAEEVYAQAKRAVDARGWEIHSWEAELGRAQKEREVVRKLKFQAMVKSIGGGGAQVRARGFTI